MKNSVTEEIKLRHFVCSQKIMDGLCHNVCAL